jgi:hypothetical protein
MAAMVTTFLTCNVSKKYWSLGTLPKHFLVYKNVSAPTYDDKVVSIIELQHSLLREQPSI